MLKSAYSWPPLGIGPFTVNDKRGTQLHLS